MVFNVLFALSLFLNLLSSRKTLKIATEANNFKLLKGVHTHLKITIVLLLSSLFVIVLELHSPNFYIELVIFITNLLIFFGTFYLFKQGKELYK